MYNGIESMIIEPMEPGGMDMEELDELALFVIEEVNMIHAAFRPRGGADRLVVGPAGDWHAES